MNELYDSCRWLNQYLGVLAFLLLMRRLVPLVLDRSRWRDAEATHRAFLFAVLAGYALVNAFGSARSVRLGNEPGVPSLLLMTLHVAAICLCVWWPHQSRSRQTTL